MKVEKIIIKYADGSERELEKGFAAELKKGKEVCIEWGDLSENEVYCMAYMILLAASYRESEDEL